jgi:hypothetical protein
MNPAGGRPGHAADQAQKGGLPRPVGPRKPKISPSLTSNEMSSTATTEP